MPPPGSCCPPLSHQAASISCTSNLVALWAQGAQLCLRVGELLFLLCLTCPRHVLTCSSQTNSVTSFRWFLKCHLLEQPQLVPTQPRTSGHSWFPCLQTPPFFSGGFLCLLEAARPSSGAVNPQEPPSPMAFRSWCLNAPVPSSLGGWVCLTLCSVRHPGVPSGMEPQVPATQGLSSLPPSSVSCHPTPLPQHLGVRFWNTSHPDTPSKAFLAHHICRKLACSLRKICPYPNPWNLRM